jgi:single-stranded DNA-binding protein
MSIDCAFFGVLHRGELKTSQSGKPYLRLSVRVGDGDAAQWVSVMAFDPDAIAAADRFVQGARIYVEGKLSLNEWTTSDGTKRHGLSVLAWHCRLPRIGRNRPKKKLDKEPASALKAGESATGDFYSDPVPF